MLAQLILDGGRRVDWDDGEVGAWTAHDESGRLVRPTPPSAPAAIDVRHLRYFLAVVEELHFGRAAERMHMSQPPLSQAIRKLEEQLGVQLLYRTSRVVEATDAGLIFAERARRILAGLDVAVAEARGACGRPPAVRIGCVRQLGVDRLHEFLVAAREALPDATIDVTHQAALTQLGHLACADLDLGILCRGQASGEVEVVPLFAGEPLSVHVHSGHRLADVEVVRPEDLAGEDLLTFPRAENPALHDHMLATAQESGYVFAAVRETSGCDPRDLMLAVASGAGVALQPLSFMERGHPGSFVVRRPIDPSLASPEMVLAWRSHPPRHLQPIVASLRELARRMRRGDNGGARAP
jgi:DNA-binding transcriptional LysR family regulator